MNHEKGDALDAKGLFQKTKNKGTDILLSGSCDDDKYDMSFPNRGKCIIFNHKNFLPRTNLNVRNGTDADAANLYKIFRILGFDTDVHVDLTVREVNDKLREAGESDHTEYSCFVCCVLSHGDYGILYAKDGKYPVDDVFASFRGDVCPSLVGKPKMFFIQACQGDQLDSGVTVKYKVSSDAVQQFKIPTRADFLIVYSTVPGFYSWRNTTNGSWFIQALCETLQEYGRSKDILSIMTIVSRRVALDFESHTPQDTSMDAKKQVPLVTSTLTRDIKFL